MSKIVLNLTVSCWCLGACLLPWLQEC